MSEKDYLIQIKKYIYADLFCPFLNDLRRLKILKYDQPKFMGSAFFIAQLKNYQIIGLVDSGHEFEIKIYNGCDIIYDLNKEESFCLKSFVIFIDLLLKHCRKI